MRVNFMGVIGPQGLLPIYYTELVIDRLRAKDRTLRDFLDFSPPDYLFVLPRLAKTSFSSRLRTG
jgi:hypothetical protein